MLRGRDILCISSIDWDFIWQGHQEIMATLAEQGDQARSSLWKTLGCGPLNFWTCHGSGSGFAIGGEGSRGFAKNGKTSSSTPC